MVAVAGPLHHHSPSLDDAPAERSGGKQGNKQREQRSDGESDDLKYSSNICIILFTGLGRAGLALTRLLLILFINDTLNSKVNIYFLFQWQHGATLCAV